MTLRTELTRDDIMAIEAYAAIRKERRAEIVARKRHRRVELGPHATFYFENYETMWLQVHEMLYIERGGEEQIADELAAYNPLIPKGNELVATVMFEIDDPARRKAVLSRLGGVEERMFLEIDGARIMSVAEQDVDRTAADGKASSVQFVHFPFTAIQVAAFRGEGARIVLGIDHPGYAHMAILPESVRAELAGDFA